MEVKRINWQDTIAIRHKVLWPNEPPEFSMVEGDNDALHFGVKFYDKIACVASVYINHQSARLRKFATLSDFQGKGIGSFMLNHLIKKLKEDGINYFWFDARESAVDFYQRFGFHSTGKRFYKNGVAYYKMYANL